jgi:hypothetical protein
MGVKWGDMSLTMAWHRPTVMSAPTVITRATHTNNTTEHSRLLSNFWNRCNLAPLRPLPRVPTHPALPATHRHLVTAPHPAKTILCGTPRSHGGVTTTESRARRLASGTSPIR